MMKIFHFFIIVISFLSYHTPVVCQNTNFSFEKLPSEIGWTENTVNDILQDHKGYIWVATWSGLKKYDGYTLQAYRQELNINNGLNGNKIKCLFEDSKNRLWIGTNYTGFYRYDRSLDKFIQYQKENNNMNSLSNNHVLAIQEDKDGFLWIGTEKGLNRFDPETESFVHFENSENKKKSKGYKGVVSLALSEGRDLWVGCEVGLDLLIKGKNGESDYFIKYYLAPENVSDDDFLRHNFVYKIIPSKIESNTLWIGTSVGLKKVKYFPEDKSRIEVKTFFNEKESNKGLSHSFVSDIYEDEERNQLWVGTYNGLNLFDIEKEQFQHFFYNKFSLNSINNNVLHSIYKDKSNRLWIGSDKGINYINFSSRPFQNIQLSESNQNLDLISSIKNAEDDKGIWISTNGTGLGFIPRDKETNTMGELLHFPVKAKLKEDLSGFISDMIIAQSGDIWLSTKGAGLIKIPKDKIPTTSTVINNPIQFTMEEKLEDDYLMALTQSKDSAIWIGYWDNGLGRLNPNTNEIIHFDFTKESAVELKKFPVVHLIETIEDGESILWVGSRGGGLLKLKYDKANKELELIHHYQFKKGANKGISNNFINEIYKPNNKLYQDELWIGTESGISILNINTNSFSYFNMSNGLQSHTIKSILEDNSGNIWASTVNGISCIIRSGEGFEVKNFDKYDGLGSKLFYDKSGLILDNGQLFFGGINGLTYFNPEEIKTNNRIPKPVIVDFRLFNKSIPIGKLKDDRVLLKQNISETKEINLTHLDNVISFEFVGLFSDEPQKLKYAYMLEGFHDDWVYTTASERIAYFTNLPYETFLFKVKAANRDGVWSDPIELTLYIAPPFWMTNWAYFLYFLLTCSLLYGVFKIVKMRTDLRHSLQLERLEREKMREVNQMKLQFFTNISHELRTPLTLIISPLEQFIRNKFFDKKIHKSVVRMYHNANRLLTMINQLLDVRKNEAGLLKLKVAEGNFIKFSNEIILAFKDLAKQQNIKLKFHPEINSIPLWYDRDQMEKVWFNLLSNAIKFTPEGGKIEVYVLNEHTYGEKMDSESIAIQIKDAGNGIPENQREHIFDRFYQVEKNTEGVRKGGTGIGLALTKSIIENHSGKIWVEDNNSEPGSTFTFLLPKGSLHFKAEEKISDFKKRETISNHLAVNTQQEKEILSKVKKNKPNGKKSSKKSLILIVEDNADIRAYLSESLESRYKIIQAKNGEDGLEKSKAELPDLILADISMPKMDGIEMCHQLKSALTTSHIPIILLTARTSLIFKIDSLEKGADDYVTKPFNMRLLEAKIKNLIDSRNQLKEKFTKNFDLSPSGVAINSVDEKLLNQIKTVVEKNIDNSNFSVEQLANALIMSRMQLYRKLKALTGKSPNKIIREIRLQRAAQLLKIKDYNVADITYMVGYNDLQYFRDQFKKEYGMSPSEYAKRQPSDKAT